MNLAKMKSALEDSVSAELKKNIKGEVKVTSEYDITNGIMRSEMITETPRTEESNASSILCYNIEYKEEDRETNIIAFNRVYLYDALGVAVVNNETIPVSRSFLEAMATIINYGMDKIYHPEKYEESAE